MVRVLDGKEYSFDSRKRAALDAYSFSNLQERPRFAIDSRFQDGADRIELAFVDRHKVPSEAHDSLYTGNGKY